LAAAAVVLPAAAPAALAHWVTEKCLRAHQTAARLALEALHVAATTKAATMPINTWPWARAHHESQHATAHTLQEALHASRLRGGKISAAYLYVAVAGHSQQQAPVRIYSVPADLVPV
jgi:hypothetical protein